MDRNDPLPKKLRASLAGARMQIEEYLPAIAKRIQDIDNQWDTNPECWVGDRVATYKEVGAIIGELVKVHSTVTSADALKGGRNQRQPPNVTSAISRLENAQDILAFDCKDE